MIDFDRADLPECVREVCGIVTHEIDTSIETSQTTILGAAWISAIDLAGPSSAEVSVDDYTVVSKVIVDITRTHEVCRRGTELRNERRAGGNTGRNCSSREEPDFDI